MDGRTDGRFMGALKLPWAAGGLGSAAELEGASEAELASFFIIIILLTIGPANGEQN